MGCEVDGVFVVCLVGWRVENINRNNIYDCISGVYSLVDVIEGRLLGVWRRLDFGT